MSWIDSLGTFLTYQLEATDRLGQHILHNTQSSNPFPSLNPFQRTPGPRVSFQSCVCLLSIYFFQWFLLPFRERVKQKSHQDKVKVKSLSHVRLFVTLSTVAYHAPLSMGFSRQQYWSGLPFPSPGDLPDPRIEPRAPELQTDALRTDYSLID